MNQVDLREIYESILGKRVSDVSWYQNRRMLEQNAENVKFLARIKKAGLRANVSVIAIMQQYVKARELLSRTNEPLSGLKIKEYLAEYGIKPHQSTISAWFRDIGGYRRRQLYQPQSLVMLFTKAFIYKINTQQIEGEK
jgi:hypothetical protein